MVMERNKRPRGVRKGEPPEPPPAPPRRPQPPEPKDTRDGRLPCAAPGCGNEAKGLSNYCGAHGPGETSDPLEAMAPAGWFKDDPPEEPPNEQVTEAGRVRDKPAGPPNRWLHERIRVMRFDLGVALLAAFVLGALLVAVSEGPIPTRPEIALEARVSETDAYLDELHDRLRALEGAP